MKNKIQFLRAYPSKTRKGELTYVYVVHGNTDAYVEAQGQYAIFDEPTGKHLWFNSSFIGNEGEIVIKDGKVFPDLNWLQQIKSVAKLLYREDLEMQMMYVASESRKHMQKGQPYAVSTKVEESAGMDNL